MSNNLDGFNADDHGPMETFEALPKGDYLSMPIDSEWKDNSKGTGRYLQWTFEVLDGEHKGRRVFDRMNLENPNATAVKIANSALADLCRATGVTRPKDSSELHGKPLIIKVDLEERNDKKGEYSNRVKGYLPVNGATKKAEPTKTTAAKPPWKKG